MPDPSFPDERLEPLCARIKQAGITFRLPPDRSSPDRLGELLAGLYLTFNEAHCGRPELAPEVLELGRELAEQMPEEPEVLGLWSLILLHDGQLLAARSVLDRATSLGGRGPYVLQAAIASLQAAEPPEWDEIAALYGELAWLTGSPIVELSRARAVAETQGALSALAIVDQLELDDSHYFHATRAELLARLGRTDEARDAYARALELVPDDSELRLLERRMAQLG